MVQVKKEIVAQIERFNSKMGYKPTHIDGHQHVHVLPGKYHNKTPIPSVTMVYSDYMVTEQ